MVRPESKARNSKPSNSKPKPSNPELDKAYRDIFQLLNPQKKPDTPKDVVASIIVSVLDN